MKNYDLQFIRVRSYLNQSSDIVTISGLEQLDITDKPVLIVEDLVDSGKSLARTLATIRNLNPSEVKIATLAYKRNPLNTYILPDFIGFSLPNDWLVGYHIDYNDVTPT